jgi:hypothetical protein
MEILEKAKESSASIWQPSLVRSIFHAGSQ